MNSKAVATTDKVSNLPAQSPRLLERIAARYGVDPDKMMTTLKATCFKGNVSNEQLMALLIVAEQYGLNPWTKEIYAFPDKNNGIVPVVGVDGWIRIVNSNPAFESMTFEDGPLNEENIPSWIECTIALQNRRAPMVIKEWFEECRRDTGPWKSHPRRMLRHKAMVQCARLALGFVGIYDPDEGERVANAIDVTPKGKPKTEAPKARIKQELAPPATAEFASSRITVDQATELADLADGVVTAEEILEHFEIDSLDELPAEKYGEARGWIENWSPVSE